MMIFKKEFEMDIKDDIDLLSLDVLEAAYLKKVWYKIMIHTLIFSY